MEFRSKYTNHTKYRKQSPTGEKIEIRHEPEINADGRRVLKPTREVPIYEMIQIGREETEIERIVKRAMEGDYNALNAMNGVYADITDAPSSLAEAQQYIINAKREFENLPADIRKEFENNPEVYVASVGTKEWFDKMGITAKIEEQNKAAETIRLTEENTAKAMANLANSTGNIVVNGKESK